jgi:hypothetical protein
VASNYATIDDVQVLFRPLSASEQVKAEAMLPLICDALRQYAVDAGKDLDAMIEASESLASVAKLVTVDIVGRAIRQSTTGDVYSQESQSGLGYSWSGSYAIPGGGIAGCIMKNDLKRLGILRQKVEAVEIWHCTERK